MGKLKLLKKSWMLLGAVILLCTSAFSQDTTPIVKRDAENELKALVSKIQASSRFVPLSFENFKLDAERTFKYQSEQMSKPDGVYGVKRPEIWYRGEREGHLTILFSPSSSFYVLSDEARLLSQQECLQKAIVVRDLLWPRFAALPGFNPVPFVEEQQYRYVFTWREYNQDGMFVRYSRIGIRGVDGLCDEIISNVAYNHMAKHKIKAKTARAMADKAIAALEKQTQRDYQLSKWDIDYHDDVYKYNFYYDAQKPFFTRTLIRIHPETGKIEDFNVTPDSHVVSANGSTQAVWTKQGLVSLSNRFRQGFERKETVRKLVLRKPNGQTSVIYNVFYSDINLRFGAPWSDWIVFGDKANDYALNLATGEAKLLGNYNRSISDAIIIERNAVKPSAAESQFQFPLALVSAMVGSEGTTRLFADSLNRPYPLGLRERIAWKDAWVFQVPADGKSVLFQTLQNDPKTKKVTTAFRRLDMDKFLAFAKDPKYDYVKNSKLVYQSANNYLDFKLSGDGTQAIGMAESQGTQFWLLDFSLKKERHLSPEKLSKQAPNVEAYVFLPGRRRDEVSFIGGKRGQKGRWIFTYAVATGQFQQMTPDGEPAVRYHVFSSGKTGFDLSKELAIDQLVWSAKLDREIGD